MLDRRSWEEEQLSLRVPTSSFTKACPNAKTPGPDAQNSIGTVLSRLPGMRIRSRIVGCVFTKSQLVSVDEAGSSSTLDRVVRGCPQATIVVIGAEIWCLLDTGMHVSTQTESFYR